MLVILSRIIGSSLRKTDTVIRWGGEEFLLVMGGVDADMAHRILEKLRENIQRTYFTVHGLNLRITVTIGACKLDMTNVEASINRADKNLYTGKTAGKNQVVIDTKRRVS